MRRVTTLIFFLSFWYFLGLASDLKNSIDVLKKVKKLYKNEKYEKAQLILKPVYDSQSEDHSEISLYVKFYYALLKYKCGEFEEASLILENIYKNHISWPNIKEVYYWLAIINFEQKCYQKALAFLQECINQGELAKNLENTKFYFLSQCGDFYMLRDCFNLYPNDFVLAKILMDRMDCMPIYERDVKLLKLFANKFELYSKDNIKISEKKFLKKSAYNVAVFLPIFIENLQNSISLESDFIFDFYQGLIFAVKDLKEMGIFINLCVYDTRRDAEVVKELLEKPEMQNMDLIIGPLYSEAIHLVSEFSKKHEIPMFNPLSENLELIGTNPFFFLFQPSVQTKAISAAKYTLKNLKADSKIAIVYSDESKSDLMAATAYKDYIEKNSTFKISTTVNIKENDASTFLGYYIMKKKGNGSMKNFYTYPIMNEITHVYVPSKDEIIATSVISAMEIIGNKACIIGDESWLSYNSIGLDQIIMEDIVFLSPTYINYDKINIYKFRKKFLAEFYQFPSIYSIVGYELLFFLGKKFQTHGTGFIKTLLISDECEREILEKISYDFSHDNQWVPIIGVDTQGKIICYN